MPRLLVLSHTSKRSGGAESALFELIQTLRTKMNVAVMFSDPNGGDERDRYESIGVPVIQFGCIWTVPDFPRSIFELCTQVDWTELVNQLRPFGFTHVLSNTIVQIHGAILAEKLQVPHILYAHEYVQEGRAFDLHPSGIGGKQYCKLLSDLSDEVWACSKFVGTQFDESKTKVVFPLFRSVNTNGVRTFDPTQPVNIVCIGTRSVRKNVAFFLILAKAVGLLGLPVHFKWIGGDDPRGRAVLEAHLRRRCPLVGPVRVDIVPRTETPFEHVGPNPIVMIASHSEPFGLTAIEAMERGIPVISSRCGGPEELLDESHLFDVDDIHGAVKCIKHVIQTYNEPRSFTFEPRIPDLPRTYTPKSLSFIERFRAVRLHDRTPERVVELIPSASSDMLEVEHQRPGTLVLNELRRFGATPFCYSSDMDNFYRDGIGMAVQLADTMHDRSKEYMISFVLSALMFESGKVLSVGDGIANDSIRLARAGLDVSYLDFDDGVMTQIAKRNVADTDVVVQFVTNDFANENPYDFVMCFEVFEHVEDPDVLVRSLAQKTRRGGLAFVSECFFGLENQWSPHLYSNERFTGMLPAMMDPWFELVDIHRAIPGKPFMFRRTDISFDANVLPSVRRWFMNASTYGAVQTAFDAKTNSFVHF